MKITDFVALLSIQWRQKWCKDLLVCKYGILYCMNNSHEFLGAECLKRWGEALQTSAHSAYWLSVENGYKSKQKTLKILKCLWKTQSHRPAYAPAQIHVQAHLVHLLLPLADNWQLLKTREMYIKIFFGFCYYLLVSLNGPFTTSSCFLLRGHGKSADLQILYDRDIHLLLKDHWQWQARSEICQRWCWVFVNRFIWIYSRFWHFCSLCLE